MNNIRLCPVSVGEIFDKLSILDIKLKYISDSRRNDVEKEFNLLFEIIKDSIKIYSYHYNLIKKINEDIWHLMDKIRTIDSNLNREEWFILCKKTIDYNDIRFRIKNKINLISNSDIKEQKSYTPTIFKLYSSSKDDFTKLNVLIKYYSIIYDIIEVKCINEVFELFQNNSFKDSQIIFQYSESLNKDNINELYIKNTIKNSDLFTFINSFIFDN